MKKNILACLLCVSIGIVSSAPSFASAASELDRRINLSKDVLDQIMMAPDQSIPEELLAKCKAIAIYPHVLKGAFIFGGRFGHGVILRHDEKTGEWSAPAFTSIGGANVGLQIGGDFTDLILVVMNERGLESLLSDQITLGGDVSAAAGPVGRTSSSGTDLFLRATMVSYSRSYGLFAGVSLDGAVVLQDQKANAEYYGRPLNARDILYDGKVSPMPASEGLVKALSDYSKRWAANPRAINRDIETVKKYDYVGQITMIDPNSGEMELLNTLPLKERPAGEAASKRIKVNATMAAPFKIGDHVKVMFKAPARVPEAAAIVKS